MSITQATVGEIKKLGTAEKIRIVEEIWDSILEQGDAPDLTEAQAAELNRRIDS
jgi:putative addiction module component (TIGR02574 family)